MTVKTGLLCALLLALPATASATEARPELETSARGVPAQLGPNARSRYQDVFTAIRDARWAEAQAKLDAMPEGPLHNIARAELYLAKGSPKVDAAMLVALATKAPELPQARQLVALAKSRGVEALPSLPSAQELGWLGSAPRRGKVAGSEVRGTMLAGKLVPLLKNDQPNEAEAILDANSATLAADTLTEWRQRIAWTYYLTGDDSAALRLAAKASAGSGDWAGQADWVAGLAAWRQRDFEAASRSFATAAQRLSDSEMVAAAHFWGARADMAGGHPERVDAKLRAAARNPENFYGLLALNRLGMNARPSDPALTTQVSRLPNVRAALSLAEIGQNDLADELIRYQARIGNPRDHAALASVAGRLNLPATQLWLAHNGPAGAQASVTARYPNPRGWQPVGGWRVDRSLVFAHALQESQFRTNVTSPAGARGLMQVMPGTAAAMARRKGEAATGSLSDPSVNMEYGQTFMETLRDMGETGGLLPKVIAAYNAGPLPVSVWNARTRDNADPLLYIESIPYWETRSYVTIVLRNYWMYQIQNEEPTRSLAALSQGMWPRFPGLAGPSAVRIDRVSGAASAD